MERRGQTQVSSVDEDVRLLRKQAQWVAGYNAQIAVDSKHKLVVTEDVIQNSTNRHQLAGMLMEAKGRLGGKQLTGLADGDDYDPEFLSQLENLVTRQTGKGCRL